MTEKRLSLFDRACWQVINLFSPQATGNKAQDDQAAQKRKKAGYMLMGFALFLTIIRLAFAVYSYRNR